jgi:hypothetical protein
MRLAVIDLGTNTVPPLVIEIAVALEILAWTVYPI